MKYIPLLLMLFSFTAQTAETQDLYRQAVHILGGNGNVVSQWQDEIKFAVIGDGKAERLAKSVISEAVEIAGLKLSFPINTAKSATDYLEIVRQTEPYVLNKQCAGGDRSQCFNFVVVITNSEMMLKLSEVIPLPAIYRKWLSQEPKLYCVFAPFIARQRIKQVIIYVREDLQPAMLRTCLQEEIYQALGLFNDYTGSKLFSFNNVVAAKKLTAYDKALLKALYDPRVRPGYPAHFVAEIFMQNANSRFTGNRPMIR